MNAEKNLYMLSSFQKVYREAKTLFSWWQVHTDVQICRYILSYLPKPSCIFMVQTQHWQEKKHMHGIRQN